MTAFRFLYNIGAGSPRNLIDDLELDVLKISNGARPFGI
jgi:hypothetical protein